MIRVGVVEYHHHWDYFKTIRDIFSTDNFSFYALMKNQNESIYKYVHRIETFSETLDLLFINTINETMKDIKYWVEFKSKCPTFLSIHNTNSCLGNPEFDKQRPLLSIYTMMSSFFMKNIIIPKFDGIIVFSDAVRDHVINDLGYKKPVFVLPFKYHQQTSDIDEAGYVVPGAIEEHRRDYDLLLKTIKPEEKWILLGRPVGRYGKRIIKQCKEMNDQGFNIKYFEGFVPEVDFEEYIKSAKAIVVPSVYKTHGLGTTTEIYNETKMMGAYFDAIKFGKQYLEIPELEKTEIDYKKYTLEEIRKRFFPGISNHIKNNVGLKNEIQIK